MKYQNFVAVVEIVLSERNHFMKYSWRAVMADFNIISFQLRNYYMKSLKYINIIEEILQRIKLQYYNE